jgi:hypothetical protein
MSSPEVQEPDQTSDIPAEQSLPTPSGPIEEIVEILDKPKAKKKVTILEPNEEESSVSSSLPKLEASETPDILASK